MGAMGTVMVAMAGMQVATSIAGGIAQKRESDFNASILHQQAGMIEEQKKLQAMQDDRTIRAMMGRTVAATAGKGIEMSGSPIAIMIDTRTQLEFDKAIGQYNLEMQKFGIMASAEAEQRRGRIAMMHGVTSGVMSGAQTLFATMPSPKPSLTETSRAPVTIGGQGYNPPTRSQMARMA
jgi:hypothetical protein